MKAFLQNVAYLAGRVVLFGIWGAMLYGGWLIVRDDIAPRLPHVVTITIGR